MQYRGEKELDTKIKDVEIIGSITGIIISLLGLICIISSINDNIFIFVVYGVLLILSGAMIFVIINLYVTNSKNLYYILEELKKKE